MANYELSNRIYELRTQKGLSQKELGAILGVSNKAVSKWETGTAIPKTETLIKLAEVFEISTEELINGVCKGEESQPTNIQNEKDILDEISVGQVRARVGKTLAEFRAENGLYLKDVAEKIGVDDSKLQEIEDSGLVPSEIAKKIAVAYGLSINDFARLVVKSQKEAKYYFLKVSVIYQLVIGFIACVPMVIGSVLVTLGTLFDLDVLLDISDYTGDISISWNLIVAVIGSIILGDYLTKHSGYIGDFQKHKFLYSVVSNGATSFISSLSVTILLLGSGYIHDTSTKLPGLLYWISQGANLVLSLVSLVFVIIVMVILMNNSIEHNIEKRRNTFKKIAIIVTVSVLAGYILNCVIERVIFGVYNSFELVKEFLFCAVDIVIVWLVYSIKESNSKKERLAFTVLPIISIFEILISDIITLIS
ncbi:MAG: transcriptional regulator [Clostridia bacterium]|nr:transcriptional regulator [Clostridia bacterium]